MQKKNAEDTYVCKRVQAIPGDVVRLYIPPEPLNSQQQKFKRSNTKIQRERYTWLKEFEKIEGEIQKNERSDKDKGSIGEANSNSKNNSNTKEQNSKTNVKNSNEKNEEKTPFMTSSFESQARKEGNF